LNENTRIWINGIKHFGRAYREISKDEERLKITCEKAGDYHILCIGTRKDDIALDNWKTGAEYK
jgi:hypothetical protein